MAIDPGQGVDHCIVLLRSTEDGLSFRGALGGYEEADKADANGKNVENSSNHGSYLAPTSRRIKSMSII